MALNEQILEILVCPQCKGGLSLIEGGQSLLCSRCELKYQIHGDVPVMVVSEAVDLKKEASISDKEGVANLPKAVFKVVDGANRGMVFQLEMGTCKAIGRASSDTNKTMMFNVDLNLSLDESTKNLVLKYISKQFRKSSKASHSKDGLGFFRRTSDIVLDDPAISRLHAMLFYDEMGIGILDLVSKNGTFVNGEEVESRLLKKGDIIELGDTKIIFYE